MNREIVESCSSLIDQILDNIVESFSSAVRKSTRGDVAHKRRRIDNAAEVRELAAELIGLARTVGLNHHQMETVVALVVEQRIQISASRRCCVGGHFKRPLAPISFATHPIHFIDVL